MNSTEKSSSQSLTPVRLEDLQYHKRVLGLPTIALYKGGEKIAEVTKDDATKEKIKEMIDSNL